MKIAIPVVEKSINSPINQILGRCEYFLVYNTESKEENYILNTAAAAQGGAGIKAAQTIVDNGADAVICIRCGENAATVLSTSGVKIYSPKYTTVKENIDALLDGTLSTLTDIHAGYHGHGQN